eukprot:343562-Prorocentrum_minimum.AAC.1
MARQLSRLLLPRARLTRLSSCALTVVNQDIAWFTTVKVQKDNRIRRARGSNSLESCLAMR